jgi:hypothetical protein
MKARKLTLILALVFVNSLVFGQDFAFKVMANKGSNEVKSGDSWQPLKTGASLKLTDELKLADNAYIALISAKGKPMELRQAGNHKVTDLAAKVGGESSVLNKYTDFILSSNAEGKKNKLGATGAVQRTTGSNAIHVHLPENQNSAIFNSVAIVTWDTEVAGPYVVIVANMASEELTRYEVAEKTTVIDLKEPKYKFNNPNDPFSTGLIVQVKSKADPKSGSKEYMIKALPPQDAEKVKQSLTPYVTELSEPTAVNKIYLASIYEEKNLLIDAIAAYEEAVKLEPVFQENYDEFLLRHNLKKK